MAFGTKQEGFVRQIHHINQITHQRSLEGDESVVDLSPRFCVVQPSERAEYDILEFHVILTDSFLCVGDSNVAG